MSRPPVTPVPPAPAAFPGKHPLEQYLAPVYALCFRLLNDPVAAEDAAQETFLQAIRIWYQFVAPPPPSQAAAPRRDPRLQWLLAIAARRALHLRRTARRFVPFVESAMPSQSAGSPETAAERAELSAQLESALRDLPDDERQAVILHHVAGLTQAEIAQALELPPRTVSHRISDGLATLYKRMEAGAPALPTAPTTNRSAPGTRGFALRGAALSALLAHVPTAAAPAGVAARVFSHPSLLAWSSSSAAVATASTATASGGAQAASVPAAHSVGSAASSITTTTTKGAMIMSSKLFLGASAALLGAAFLAWSTGRFDSPPAMAARPTVPILAVPAVEVATPNRTRPAGRTLSSTGGDPGASAAAASVTPPAPPQLSVAEREAAFAQHLSAEQAAERARLREAFAAPLPNEQEVPPHPWSRAEYSTAVLRPNTSLGEFQIQHAVLNGAATNRLQALPPAEGPVRSFLWGQFQVLRSSAMNSSSGLFGESNQVLQVTSCGRDVRQVNVDGASPDGNLGSVQLAPSADGERLFTGDLWPVQQPVQYEPASVLERAGLNLVDTGGLADLLAQARQADTRFVAALRAWREALAAKDSTAADRSSAAAWQAANELITAQNCVCEAIARFLRDGDSGHKAWAVLSVSGAESKSGLNLPPLQQILTGRPMMMGSGSASSETNAPAGANQAAHDSDHLAMPAQRSYKLEVGGESLAHLVQLINQNPGTHGSVTVDAALAGNTAEGTFTGASLEALLKGLAKTARVDCQPNGANAWKLVPKSTPATPPGAGEGF